MVSMQTPGVTFPTFPSLVDSLLASDAYPHPTGKVDLIETHISYIFLAGAWVYKVKKPVVYDFLDFSTLERRRYFCQREVDLNNRLSPDVYLGVSEIRCKDGRLAVDGIGDTVEYAVKMRRLPSDLAMDSLLRADSISMDEVRRVAQKVATFHPEAATGLEITRLGGLDNLRRIVLDNLAEIEQQPNSPLSGDDLDDLDAYSRAFVEVNEQCFLDRAAQGRVRDWHGDLHAANIFLENGVSIIDSIEFNDSFRYSDVTADIAFLGMDLDFFGHRELSSAFVNAYAVASGDHGVYRLLDFFKCYRACVRGKVTSYQLADPDLDKNKRKERRGNSEAYFRLALSYLPRSLRHALVLVTGVTGTGKSTLATELARRRDMLHLNSDLVRKELAGISPQEHRYTDFKRGIYSLEMSRRTYSAMLERAKAQLEKGGSVVLDGTYRRAEDRARVAALAADTGADFWIVECVLPEEEARRRLDAREALGVGPSDGRWELYHQQMAEWEAVREVGPERYIRLDTQGRKDENNRALLKELYTRLLA